VTMAAGDLDSGSGLVSAIAASATGRGSLNLSGFTSDSTATGVAGTYSFTTSDRGTMTLDASTSITTNGNAAGITVSVGSDSTFASASNAVISAAGTITATSVTVASDATTSGELSIGEVGSKHTAASVNLAETAANGMDLNLVGATFTKLTVTLDGSTAITVANAADASIGVTGGVDPGLTINFDGNAEALAVYNSTTAVTITELVLNAGSSTGTNTLDVSAAAKANVTGGTGADAITGTSGADTISGGSGADNITGGTGADYMTGGAGADTFVFAVAASVASTANTLGTTIAAGNTVTFGSSVDYISDFGSTDILDITTAATVPTSLLGLTTATALTAGTSYVAYGTWDSTTGMFTIAAAFNASTAKDAMVIVDGNSQTAITSTGVVILDDLTAALLAGNIG